MSAYSATWEHVWIALSKSERSNDICNFISRSYIKKVTTILILMVNNAV
jgi:hypothetical protein